MALSNGLAKSILLNDNLVFKGHFFFISTNIKLKKNPHDYIERLNHCLFRSNEKINHYYTSSKCYSTNNHKTPSSGKATSKFKVSKIILYLIMYSSGFYFFYNVFLYKFSLNSMFQSSKLQSFFYILHSTYNLIKDNLILPYNSFVLLNKLQPVSKGIEKTLVLNLNKTLVSYHYSLFRGFEVFARPGLIKFIQELGKVYEIVLFSNEDLGLIEDIVKQIDPKGEFIRFKLGKEAMRIYKGKTIKDLTYLNRNLDNVVVVDVEPENVLLHPNNAIIIPEFNGNGKDRELLLMIVFLKDMAKESVKNIRQELKKYGHYKPYMKYYSSFLKYHKLLPNTLH